LSGIEVHLPQKDRLRYTNIFDVTLDGKRCLQWMASCPHTCIKNTGYWYEFYRNKPGDESYTPRYEVIFGWDSHQDIHLKCGSQPFGSYLRGHIKGCMAIRSSPQSEWQKPDISKVGDFITCQMYYTSNITREDYLPEMVEILKCGLLALLKLDLIGLDTQVYLEDHSHDWNSYLCHPFLPLQAEKILRVLLLPSEEVLRRFRTYSRYGKDYTDKEKALACFQI